MPPSRRRRALLLTFGTAVALVASACGGATTAGSGGSTTTSPTSAAGPGGPAPTVPTSGAYLGAWVHPVVVPGTKPFVVEQENTPALRAAAGRPLGILHLFTGFRAPAPVADLRWIERQGSTPLLDWGCGVTDSVVSGAEDAHITAVADALRAFGHPVFVRYCWEMNSVKAHPQVGGPSGFVANWDHVVRLFRRAGATNVAFVWCPGVAGADPAPYYPGRSEVDWIGVDGYDRTGTATFSSLFSAFAATWAGQGRPMMVAETGAMDVDQAAYVDSIGRDAPTLPAFKAVCYFDRVGPAGSWILQGDGLAAFGRLAATPYFRV
jgi:hypothetical protein